MNGGEVAKAAETAVELLKTAYKQGWLDKLATSLRKKHKVLVLGSTGAGKTNLLESLTELIPKAVDQMNRTEFAQKRSIKISKQPFVFIDTPGQILHKNRRITAIRKAMAGKIDGVINVVSYGYHEHRLGKKEAIGADGTIDGSFLERHRQVEIDSLKEWTLLLGGRETVRWLITVVSKADLWWHRREEVLAHYQSGKYYDALGEAQTLNPVVLEYCSVFHKFYGEGAMSGTFDEADRVRTRSHLLGELLAAVGERSDG